MSKARILVIDDEESPRESMRFILKDRYDVTLTESGPSGLEALGKNGPFDVVLLDMKMPQMDGLEVLSKILQFSPTMPVVMVTAITEAKPAVQAMKMGAADYLNKPFDVDEIRLVVDRILKEKALEREVGRLRTELQVVSKFENIVGNGAAMQKVYGLIQRVVDTDTSILVLGETGTGKELVARARFPANCWKANCSVTKRALSRARGSGVLACLRPPAAEPCSLMKLAKCRSAHRVNCCAPSRNARSGA
jgi:DNA-binding NtrC family response regulator